jgi:hypothetical protein
VRGMTMDENQPRAPEPEKAQPPPVPDKTAQPPPEPEKKRWWSRLIPKRRR